MTCGHTLCGPCFDDLKEKRKVECASQYRAARVKKQQKILKCPFTICSKEITDTALQISLDIQLFQFLFLIVLIACNPIACRMKYFMALFLTRSITTKILFLYYEPQHNVIIANTHYISSFTFRLWCGNKPIFGHICVERRNLCFRFILLSLFTRYECGNSFLSNLLRMLMCFTCMLM